MDRAQPLVSIITPAYNRAGFLDETIQSVLGQDYPNIEYLVLDDGSKDNTQEVLRRYEGKLRWETHPNMGETRTVNKGFEMTKGEIVCVVNSDDPLLPGAVRAGVETLAGQPEALVAYPDWVFIDAESRQGRQMRLPQYDLFRMLLDFHVCMGPGTFIRRSTLAKIGLRDTQFRYAGDLEYWFRAALHGPLAHIPRILATHRVHGDSASVLAKGGPLAKELQRTLQKTMRDPLYPPELHRLHNMILRRLHYIAKNHCANDRPAWCYHVLQMIRYDLCIRLGLPRP